MRSAGPIKSIFYSFWFNIIAIDHTLSNLIVETENRENFWLWLGSRNLYGAYQVKIQLEM